MTKPLMQVENLKTWFDSSQGTVRAVDGVDFEINRGETYALLGESGCGKSMTALSMMQLVPAPAGKIVSGRVVLDDQELLTLSEVQMRSVRGGRIAMIFQEPQTSLNAVMTIGSQIEEVLRRHGKINGSSMRTRVTELLNDVGIPDPVHRYREYPHQLSGGMKQRVMIAMALAGEPDLLIADEPTTALDVTIQAQVLDLVQKLQRNTGMAILLITHDLGVVAKMADRVAVMYAGQIVEEAARDRFFSDPKHPYSRKLFDSVPGKSKRGKLLDVIQGSVPSLGKMFSGCRFVDRCDYAWEVCQSTPPEWLPLTDNQGVRCHLHNPELVSPTPTPQRYTSEKALAETSDRQASNDFLLKVEGLKVHFPVHKGIFKHVVGHVRAVDGISLGIRAGHTLALVGESGCGKTTAGKGLLQLIRPTGGSVLYQQTDLTQLNRGELRQYRKDLQFIFQDPFASMNQRMMVKDIIREGMIALSIEGNRGTHEERVADLLEKVGLLPEHMYRYPHEFSGGQRQRICIARALAVDPRLIICDEPTSALDVSVQAQILNLLKGLQNDLGLSYLFITHNMSVVEYLAHDIAVMYLGRIVEQGTVDDVLNNPQHPYTQALLSAVPVIDQANQREVIKLEGDMPSPVNPPGGCHFHPRCPKAMPECRQAYPDETQLSSTHMVRCLLLEPASKDAHPASP